MLNMSRPKYRQTASDDFYMSKKADIYIPPPVAKWAVRLAIMGLKPIFTAAVRAVNLIGKKKRSKQREIKNGGRNKSYSAGHVLQMILDTL